MRTNGSNFSERATKVAHLFGCQKKGVFLTSK